MADKEKLASERLQLSVRKKKLELTVTNEETIDPNISKGDDQVPASPMVDYLFKIVLIGDAGCGKTSLMKRFVDDIFHCDTLTTIGVDFSIKTLTIDGATVKLQIWDTAGQERFAPAGQLYYHGANAVMIAYDITNKASFENINKWKEKFEEKNEEESGLIKLLVGCKADLENRREVSEDAGKTGAIQMGFRWKETSSKTGSNVSDLFLEVAKMILIEKRSQLSIRSDMSIRYKPKHLAPGVEIPTDDGRPIKSHSTRPTEAIRMMSIRRRAKSVRAPPAFSKKKTATSPRNSLNDSKLESEKKTPKSCCSIS